MNAPSSFRAAATAALLLSAGAAGPARALDVPPPGTAAGQRVIFDSSPDVAHGGRSIDVNTTFAPFGTVGESGFRARLTGSWSWYDFIADPATRSLASGRSQEGDLLAGYGLVGERISVIALYGVAFVHSVDAGIATSRRGQKAVLSAYARPTDQTMAYGQVTYLTVNESLQVQAKVGWKLPFGVYLGPEGKYASNTGGHQVRLGAHLSGIALGPLVLSLSAGHLTDSNLGEGAFAGLNVYASF